MQFSSNFIQCNGVNLHYYRTGGEKAPLVLVHGISDDAMCWQTVAEALSEDFDVVMVDARGHGMSEAPEEDYTLFNMATDLAGVIEGLGLNQPIVVGHSMGAMTTLVLAGMFPKLPKAILLEDPPPFWNIGVAEKNDTVRNILASILTNKRKTFDDLRREGIAKHRNWSNQDIENWINAKHRYDPKIRTLASPSDKVSIDLPALAKKILCPVMVLGGDPIQGGICTAMDMAALAEHVPNMVGKTIVGSGHSIHRDKLVDFLENLRTFASADQRGTVTPSPTLN